MKKITSLIIIVSASLLVGEALAKRSSEIVMGFQDSKIKKVLKKWGALQKEIKTTTGVRPHIVAKKDPTKIGKMVSEGDVDILIDSLYQIVILDPDKKLDSKLNLWKKGVREYAGCIVTTPDSGINSLADLKGKVVGFEDPYSTSSYALPMTLIKPLGIKNYYLDAKKAKKANKAKSVKDLIATYSGKPDGITKVFTNEDDTTLTWLKNGTLKAAGIACPKVQGNKEFKILGESSTVPRVVFAIKKDFNPKWSKGITDMILNLDPGSKALINPGKMKKVEALDNQQLTTIEKLRPMLLEIFNETEKEIASKLTH